MRKSLIVLLTFGLVLALTSVAGAQESEFFYHDGPTASKGTPDGEPPSEESVCDGEKGAAYGLCVAYCEAMDCDSGDPQASDKACDRVLGNYEKITGSVPPCVCPCVTGVPEWLAALNGEFGGIQACTEIVSPGNEFVGLVAGDGRVPGSQSVTGVIGFCGFAFGSGGFLVISPEEAAACNTLVRAKADQAGVECQ